MMYAEDDYLMISGLQHFAYCRRQWALIHIEQQWAENVHTIDGQLFHKKAHDGGSMEKRGDLLIMRGLTVKSGELGLTGVCDVVEFHRSERGISLFSYDGLWQPYPVEYKKGRPKAHNADELQLCAEAMCLEEMLLCEIPDGSLFYGQNRRRTQVTFSEELRIQVKSMAREMHELWEKGYTPKAKMNKSCGDCSLKDTCIPRLGKTRSVSSYIEDNLSVG